MGTLDLTGSFIVGGIILFTLTAVFVRFTSSSQSAIINEFTQSSLTNVSEVIDHDFNKLGYRVGATNKITSIDTASISFLADLNNDGTIDSISYYTKTVNGYLKLVRRNSSLSPAEWEVTIDDFDVIGYDSVGTATYTIANVRSLKIGLLLNNEIFTTDSTEIIGAYWEKRYYPKNL